MLGLNGLRPFFFFLHKTTTPSCLIPVQMIPWPETTQLLRPLVWHYFRVVMKECLYIYIYFFFYCTVFMISKDTADTHKIRRYSGTPKKKTSLMRPLLFLPLPLSPCLFQDYSETFPSYLCKCTSDQGPPLARFFCKCTSDQGPLPPRPFLL